VRERWFGCLAKSSWRLTSKSSFAKCVDVAYIERLIDDIVTWYRERRKERRVKRPDDWMVREVIAGRYMTSCKFGATEAMVIGS
jgi:hypothetical protein